MEIRLKEISKIYNQGKTSECIALKEVSLTIKQGEFVTITGKSGSGKSTLLHILGLSDTYTSGAMYIDDVNLNLKKEKELAKMRNSRIGFVLQDFALIPHMSVKDNVMAPVYIAGKKPKNIEERYRNIMDELGILGLENKKATQLSGGQCQRVAIARALINEPDMILADEPTGALDSENAQDVVTLLEKINEKGTTIVMVTHDEGIALHGKRQIVIKDGCIEADKVLEAK